MCKIYLHLCLFVFAICYIRLSRTHSFKLSNTPSFESQCNATGNKSVFLDGICLVKEGPGTQSEAKQGCKRLPNGKLMSQYLPDKVQTIVTALREREQQKQTSFPPDPVTIPLSPPFAIGESLVIHAKLMDDPSLSIPYYFFQKVHFAIRKGTNYDYLAEFRLINEITFLTTDKDGIWGPELRKPQPLIAGNTYTFEIRAEATGYDIYIDGVLFHQHPYRFAQGTYADELLIKGVLSDLYSVTRNGAGFIAQCLRVALEATKRTSGGPATEGWVWNSKLRVDQSWDAKNMDWDTTGGEPNNVGGQELCACYDTISGKLHDISCSANQTYICAYEEPDAYYKFTPGLKGKKGANSSSVIAYNQNYGLQARCGMSCGQNPMCKAFSFAHQNTQCITYYDTSAEMTLENDNDFEIFDKI